MIKLISVLYQYQPLTMDEIFLNKDVLGEIFSHLPGKYSDFVVLCREAKSILRTDCGDALIANGWSVEITYDEIAWFKNGLAHSMMDNPAVIKFGKYKWYENGLLHRDNGPALIRFDSTKWYTHGIMYHELTLWDEEGNDFGMGFCNGYFQEMYFKYVLDDITYEETQRANKRNKLSMFDIFANGMIIGLIFNIIHMIFG